MFFFKTVFPLQFNLFWTRLPFQPFFTGHRRSRSKTAIPNATHAVGSQPIIQSQLARGAIAAKVWVCLCVERSGGFKGKPKRQSQFWGVPLRIRHTHTTCDPQFLGEIGAMNGRLQTGRIRGFVGQEAQLWTTFVGLLTRFGVGPRTQRGF